MPVNTNSIRATQNLCWKLLIENNSTKYVANDFYLMRNGTSLLHLWTIFYLFNMRKHDRKSIYEQYPRAIVFPDRIIEHAPL